MKIGLIPLDERPVNTRFPRMIGAIAGLDVTLPPSELLSHFRKPADCAALGDWLLQNAPEMDALVLSLEMLVYGGLVPSRITDDSPLETLRRLDILRELKRRQTDLPIYAFGLVTRISKNRASVEEPSYWHESGPELYAYSQQYDAQHFGGQSAPEHSPEAAHLQDMLRRRARNHLVNLATLDLLADDIFDLLVISSDDTSEYSFGTREKAWLREWARRRGDDPRLLMYPGADEVGSALLARAMLAALDEKPRFFVHPAIPADAERIAPFEDGPVRLTLQRQIRAVGGEQVEHIDQADLLVALNTPAPSGSDFFDPAHAKSDRAYRAEAIEAFAAQIADWTAAGKRVIVCDVAYPNGSDPVLIEALQRHVPLLSLAAYGAWNTAGNTIGVALAQGIANLRRADATAAQQFLARRFIEDHCFMHCVRPQLDASATLYSAETEREMTALTARDLQAEIEQMPDLRGWRVSNVRLPWRRRFEVDFDLEC
ncbi:MAG: DUF4127 family protein [Chloroflexi bacterium]|nr:DUF4127 family protein [Chloroflexota bacterium]MCY3582192.1 DUF4127 family protein [Chloroflexota bacterium]MCY3715185.1 DUF4127 family protein [Chloroflexota bacterium]MDE2649956.1 DUF4127 family protein [Chloroflexota bacterium]MXX52368.1 DUF4127 family protein [Chloroflexota bacterium]